MTFAGIALPDAEGTARRPGGLGETTGGWWLPGRALRCRSRFGSAGRRLRGRMSITVGSREVDLGDPLVFGTFLVKGLLRRSAELGSRVPGDEVVGFVLLRIAEVLGAAADPAFGPGRVALLAALAARNAAILGDAEGVDGFSRVWLGLSRPERWREAVEMALLGDWVQALGSGRATDDHITGLLKRHADVEHRRLQPLWERKVRGRRTALLSEPVGVDRVVADLLVDHRSPEAEALWSELADSRLLGVLRGLEPAEAEVAAAWAADPGANWTRAAAAADHPSPAAFGERVRRKLKRLGGRSTERALAAAAVAR
ncbi:hypothetical protein ACPC54_32810 [Kitasatospora sp. NPDC094028]